MESTTYMKQLRISPKKLRISLNAVKKYSPQQALDVLMYTTSQDARIFYNAIKSSIHNAVQTLKVTPDVLQFKTFTVEQGRALKRYRPGARGGVRPVKKRFSHIKIVLVAKSVEMPVAQTIDKPKKTVKKVAIAEKKPKVAKKKTVIKSEKE